MALSKDDILNAIAEMSVWKLLNLVEAMEEKFGVSAQLLLLLPPCCWLVTLAAAEEQTEFDVVLTLWREESKRD